MDHGDSIIGMYFNLEVCAGKTQGLRQTYVGRPNKRALRKTSIKLTRGNQTTKVDLVPL